MTIWRPLSILFNAFLRWPVTESRILIIEIFIKRQNERELQGNYFILLSIIIGDKVRARRELARDHVRK